MCPPLEKAANMLLMEDVCRMILCCLVHKVIYLKEPQYFSGRLSYHKEFANRSTQHGGRLHFPRVPVRLVVGQRGVSYFGLAVYNWLPYVIKNCNFC